MSDERKQTEALLAVAVVVCLWLSHSPAAWWPEAPGNYDLRLILRFWNKPLWINWPLAIVYAGAAMILGKRIFRELRARELKTKEGEARWMADKVQKTNRDRVFRRIL